MKIVIKIVMFVVLMTSIIGADYGYVSAQGNAENVVNFSVLGQTEIGLQGPFDMKSFSFRVPADWEFLEGGQLHLDFSTFFNTGDLSTSSGAGLTAGYLQITLNNVSIATITLNQVGDNSIDIPLYAYAWNLVDPMASSRLEFTVRTPGPCNTAFKNSSNPAGGLNVTIHPSSFFLLPHTITSLAVDLRLLPYPVFQNSFAPDSAILIMPDNPTEKELQAAFITSAAFGRLSLGALNLTSTTMKMLDQARISDSHLIFVGKPSEFPLLAQAIWPTQTTEQGFLNTQIGENDGVIQMALSPRSPAKVWIMVSGLSDDGVVKAAQAVANMGNIRIDGNPGLSIVTGVQEMQFDGLGQVDTKFSDLGYNTQNSWGPGIRYTQYIFNIPSGQEVGYDAYLDLIFTHSAMLDFDGAGISVSLNGDYIGSFRFSEQTAQVSKWRLSLPKSSFVQGENRLLISANLVALSSCLPTNQLWFSSRSDSILHLPLETASVENSRLLLRKYPAPFFPSLDNTAFVVPGNDPSSWFVVSQIAFDLGWKTTGVVINPLVAFADSVPDTIRNERDILLVGRPSLMANVMRELTVNMPAPFENGNDIANEPPGNFSFDVPDNIAVGYLQIFSSPWNTGKSVLAVNGNGIDGVHLAADALTVSDQFSQLGGNMAVIYKGQIIAAQATSDQVTVLGTPAAVVTQTSQIQQQPTSQSGSITLTPSTIAVILIVIFALVVIVFLVLRGSEQQRKSN